AIALVVLTGLAFALRSCLGAKAPAKKTDPWACGYEPNEHMPVVATSFASDVELFMGPLYTLREVCTKICWSIAHVFQKLTGVAQGVEPLPDRFLVDAPSEGADKLAGLASKIEGGNYSVYICYIVAALVVFLVLAVVMV
ncbi:hydrogenase 4 subunit B, partial [Collinsella aerofaciens]